MRHFRYKKNAAPLVISWFLLFSIRPSNVYSCQVSLTSTSLRSHEVTFSIRGPYCDHLSGTSNSSIFYTKKLEYFFETQFTSYSSSFPLSTLILACSIARYKSMAADELGSTPNTSKSFVTASLVRSDSCECSRDEFGVDDLGEDDESEFVAESDWAKDKVGGVML